MAAVTNEVEDANEAEAADQAPEKEKRPSLREVCMIALAQSLSAMLRKMYSDTAPKSRKACCQVSEMRVVIFVVVVVAARQCLSTSTSA